MSWQKGAADVCLSLSWPSLPLLELAPSSRALAKGIGLCVGPSSACCLPARSVGVRICCGSRSRRPGLLRQWFQLRGFLLRLVPEPQSRLVLCV